MSEHTASRKEEEGSEVDESPELVSESSPGVLHRLAGYMGQIQLRKAILLLPPATAVLILWLNAHFSEPHPHQPSSHRSAPSSAPEPIPGYVLQGAVKKMDELLPYFKDDQQLRALLAAQRRVSTKTDTYEDRALLQKFFRHMERLGGVPRGEHFVQLVAYDPKGGQLSLSFQEPGFLLYSEERGAKGLRTANWGFYRDGRTASVYSAWSKEE